MTAPARLAGQILLVHEYADQVKSPRQAWTYNPGQRRVRLAPNVAYDNPGTAADGLRTNDDFFMYNGATDRYDWKLVGKREIYIPYNAYRLNGNAVKYTDVIRPNHLNPELARYELHRVWVVEATIKTGTSHIYPKRTFYIDEDSWAVAVTDKYDGRGELWRVAELHPINFYNVPMHYPAMEVHHDLQSSRYIGDGAAQRGIQGVRAHHAAQRRLRAQRIESGGHAMSAVLETVTTDWVVMGQERIDLFAACTGDDQWIHVDVERARRESPFGGTIAHGYLTLSLLAPMIAQAGLVPAGARAALNYGLDRVRFVTPVRAGARVRGQLAIASAEPQEDGRTLLKVKCTLEIEGEPRPALVAEALCLVVE